MCARCGRYGHPTVDCYSKTHRDGQELPSKKVDLKNNSAFKKSNTNRSKAANHLKVEEEEGDGEEDCDEPESSLFKVANVKNSKSFVMWSRDNDVKHHLNW